MCGSVHRAAGLHGLKGAVDEGGQIPAQHGGAPLDDLDVTESDLTRRNVVAQFGLPPNRIDVLTGISGLGFDTAWPNRVEGTLEGVVVPVLGIEDLVSNKRASGRDKDRADLKGLEGKS